ncbi:MAG: zinc-binding dehydrogenase [Cyclobacteriaceae bacterium]
MKAYLLNKSGKANVLKINEVPGPELQKTDDVLIKVEAIGINYAEVLSRKGQYSWAPPRPYVPGMECYGEVVAKGEDITHLKAGDKVIAGGQYGSYAEYKVASGHLVFPAVKKFSAEENAAFLVNFMTAWVVIDKQARLQQNEIALIHAAAGGVGTAAVQIAAAKGATVIGTAGSKEKLAIVKGLGAKRTINYRSEDFYELIKREYGGVDMVLEVVGGDVYKKSVRLLKPFGRICVAGYASIPLNKWNPFTYWSTWKNAPKANIMNMAKGSQGLFATHIGYLTENKDLSGILFNEIKDFSIEREIRPVVGKIFSFDEIPEAQTFMEERKSHGKIVIKID